MLRRKLEAIGLVVVTLALSSQTALAEGRDGDYRGMMVCTKLNNSQFILRAPLDITISGKTVVAARPVFNVRGTLVVASEIATGASPTTAPSPSIRSGTAAVRASPAATAARSPKKPAR